MSVLLLEYIYIYSIELVVFSFTKTVRIVYLLNGDLHGIYIV